VRGADVPGDHLLRPVVTDVSQQGAHDVDELVRAHEQIQNPFEHFDPAKFDPTLEPDD
jgi:hypothetical protein